MSIKHDPYAPPRAAARPPSSTPRWPGWVSIGISIYLAIQLGSLGSDLAKRLGSPWSEFPVSWLLGALGPVTSILVAMSFTGLVFLPLVTRFTAVVPSGGEWALHDERIHPAPEGGRWWIQKESAILGELGFQPIILLASPRTPYLVGLFRGPGEIAAALETSALGNRIIVWTPLANDRELVTQSASGPTLADDAPPWTSFEALRDLDTATTVAVHRARLGREQTPPVLEALERMSADPLGYMEAESKRRQDWDVSRGRAFRDGNGAVRPTLRGAFFVSSRLVPWVQWILRARASRRSRDRLKELAPR